MVESETESAYCVGAVWLTQVVVRHLYIYLI